MCVCWISEPRASSRNEANVFLLVDAGTTLKRRVKTGGKMPIESAEVQEELATPRAAWGGIDLPVPKSVPLEFNSENAWARGNKTLND